MAGWDGLLMWLPVRELFYWYMTSMLPGQLDDQGVLLYPLILPCPGLWTGLVWTALWLANELQTPTSCLPVVIQNANGFPEICSENTRQ